MELVQETARLLESTKLEPWGFNYLSNQGKIAGQEVNHFHFHIIPKYEKNNGFVQNNNISKNDRDIEDIFSIIKKKL
jgi:histidine triad (HIT) family protein